MDLTIEYWYWLALGLVLIAAEMAIASFFIIWFGIGALLVGGLMLVFDLNLAQQLTTWAVTSSFITLVWFKFFNPSAKTKLGQAKGEFIGQTGLMSKEYNDGNKGEIMFQVPILGAEKWPVVAKEATRIKAGTRAKVVDILGQTLVVEPAE